MSTAGTVTAEGLTAPSPLGVEMGGTAQPPQGEGRVETEPWPSSTGSGMEAWPSVPTGVPELGARGWACWGGARGRGLYHAE